MKLCYKRIKIITKKSYFNRKIQKLDFSFSAFNNSCVEGVSLDLKLNIAGWSSLVARRAHKTHLKFGSLLGIISVIGIYRILGFLL